MHFFQVITAFGAVESGLLRKAQVIEVIGLIYKSLIAYHFTVVVNEDVAHDSVHPSFKVSVGSIFIFVI